MTTDEQALPALVAEGLDYFDLAGDEGDRRYVKAIREHIAQLGEIESVLLAYALRPPEVSTADAVRWAMHTMHARAALAREQGLLRKTLLCLAENWEEDTEDRENFTGYPRGAAFAFFTAATELRAALAAAPMDAVTHRALTHHSRSTPMDVRNNHLVSHTLLEGMTDGARKAFTQVPDELSHAAHVALGGKLETTVSMTSGGKLSEWARKERNKAKNKRKQAKASRRGNR